MIRAPESLSDSVHDSATWRYFASGTWDLTFAYLGYIINRFDLIAGRGDDSLESGWWLSTMGARLQATHHKDHIYGLLGLSGISLHPNYSDSVSTADVYSQYVKAWLDVSKTRPTPSTSLPELFFLQFAGICLFPDQDLHASWVPNYPASAMSSDVKSI